MLQIMQKQALYHRARRKFLHSYRVFAIVRRLVVITDFIWRDSDLQLDTILSGTKHYFIIYLSIDLSAILASSFAAKNFFFFLLYF